MIFEAAERWHAILKTGFCIGTFAFGLTANPAFSQEGGTWEGVLICSDMRGAEITFDQSTRTGTFSVSLAGRRGPSDGSFRFSYNVDGNQIVARPMEWMNQTSKFDMVGFEGRLNNNGRTLDARVTDGNCRAIRMGKVSDEVIVAGTTPQNPAPNVPPEFPAPIEVQSSFSQVSMDTFGVSMTMTAQEISDILGEPISKGRWNFFNAQGLEPARINIDDLGPIRLHTRNGENTNSVVVDLSQWHTGNVPLRIVRRVESSINDRPLASTFKDAVVQKYGPPAGSRSVRGVQILSWPYSRGTVTPNCALPEVPRRLIEAYGLRTADGERMLEQMATGELCDGHLQIEYETDAADQVEQYIITITDMGRLVGDIVNGDKVQAVMQEKFREAARAGNAKAPDL